MKVFEVDAAWKEASDPLTELVKAALHVDGGGACTWMV
jgi:hypothetical protein